MSQTVFIELVLAIPIIAIVMSMSQKMLHSYMDYKVKMRQNIGFSGIDVSADLGRRIEQLQSEMDRMRSITTEYDLSIQHTLEDVQHRLEVVETKSSTVAALSTGSKMAEHPTHAMLQNGQGVSNS
jgi:TolA-binding protein